SIEDVFPSYAKKIFEQKKRSEDHSIFKGLKIGDEIDDLEFSFSHIKEFISENEPFLEIVRSIFMKKIVDYDYLLAQLMNKIQIDFANDRYLKIRFLKAFIILKSLYHLKLIDQTQTTDSFTMENK